MRNDRGKISKTGRAQFSDGTYLEFVNGILVGGNTKGGALALDDWKLLSVRVADAGKCPGNIQFPFSTRMDPGSDRGDSWKYGTGVNDQPGGMAEPEFRKLLGRIWAGAMDTGYKLYQLGRSEWIFYHRPDRSAYMAGYDDCVVWSMDCHERLSNVI